MNEEARLIRLLETMADAMDTAADTMHKASRQPKDDGRTLVVDYYTGVRDGLRLAADHVREVEVVPADHRGQVAAYIAINPQAMAETPRG